MSKSEFKFSADGIQISDHQKEFKSPKNKTAKLTNRNQGIVFI